MKEKFCRIPLGITNCYLLQCEEGLLLIDTGRSDAYDRFLERMEEEKLDVGEIRFLLLTHHHEDHTGFAARLAEHTGCRIIAHEKALQLIREGRTNAMKPLNLRAGAAFSLFRLFQKSQGYPPIELSVNDIVIFGDNDTLLRELGVDGEILETPGHSADSISVLLEDGSLFAGDMAMNIMKPLGLKYRPIYSEEPEEVFRSWEKVKAAGAKTVYPAHGEPFPAVNLR